MNDFDRIARVIRHLNENLGAQPSLDDLAASVGLSPSHFHRLFHHWAGVTPKDFLQCLTAEFAREKLRESATVLDVAFQSGLSGSGRLHDLMVSLEAASPGEIKSKGAGLKIDWGFAESPFGLCSIGWTNRGICHLAFPDTVIEAEPPDLKEDWELAELRRNDRSARAQAKAIFNFDPADGSKLKAFVCGTPFQVKVWRALLRIPTGALTTYGRIAEAIGAPDAVRAVGTACGRNAVSFLIPCHRVIRETGIVQGYRWGSERKQAILAWETSGRNRELSRAR